MQKPSTQQTCNTFPCMELRDDSFDVIENSSITILYSDLSKNDTIPNGTVTQSINCHSEFGGTMQQTVTGVTFTPTVTSGEPAGFKYNILTTDGETSNDATVTINVKPSMNNIFNIMTSNDLQNWIANKTPLTMSNIFNNWQRIGEKNLFFEDPSLATGEAAAWKLTEDQSAFFCTRNTSYYTGMIYQQPVDNYIMEVTLSSTNTDNDAIGAIVAFDRSTGNNQFLTVVRAMSAGSFSNSEFCLSLQKSTGSSISENNIAYSTNSLVNNSTSGWSTSSPTRIRIERTPSSLKCACSAWNSTEILNNSIIEINFDDYPDLAFCKNPCKYGLTCKSQSDSSYSNLNIIDENGINSPQIMDYEKNEVWEYINNQWTKTSLTIQDVIGFPKIVTSAFDGSKYEITQDTITKIS